MVIVFTVTFDRFTSLLNKIISSLKKKNDSPQTFEKVVYVIAYSNIIRVFTDDRVTTKACRKIVMQYLWRIKE